MANPTQAQIDKLTVNLTRWDNIVNLGPEDTVVLDFFTVKTVSGYLTELRATNPRGAWATAISYALKDIVAEAGYVYICVEAHTSGTFNTDLTNGKWAIYQLDVTSSITFGSDITIQGKLLIKNNFTLTQNESQFLIENETTGESACLQFEAVADNGSGGNAGAIYFNAGSDGSTTDNKIEFNANHQNNLTPQLTISGNGNVEVLETFIVNTDRFYVDNSANYSAFGSTNPQGLLGGDAGVLILDNTADAEVRLGIKNDSKLWILETDGADSDKFKIRDGTSSNDRLTIDNIGNVTIGTSRQTVITNSNDGLYKTGSTGGWTFNIAGATGSGGTFLGGFGATGIDDTISHFYIGTESNKMFYILDDNRTVLGTGNSAASALLTLNSGNKGFLPPRMSTTQRNNISGPVSGLIIYNTTTGKLNLYGASYWEEISSL